MPDPPSQKQKEKFSVLTARKERLWQRLQKCQDMIANLPADIDVFKLRVAQLDTTREEFTALMDDFAVLESIHTDFATNVLSLTTAFDNLYYIILAEAGKYAHPIPPPTTMNATSTTPSVNLPTIHLTKFNGSYETFPAFIALYNNLIHNSNLPDIKKFSYLLGYVENSALKLLETVTFSPENYDIAYKLLTKRYTNKRLIANHYLAIFFNIKPLKSESHNGIRELVDALHSCVASLKSLNIAHLEDYLLTEFSPRLLDTKTRKRFEADHLEDEFPKFEDLVQFLRDQCAIFDLTHTVGSTSSAASKASCSFEKPYDRKRISMGVQELDQPVPKPIVCPLCSEDHRLKSCHSFLAANPKARYEIVRKHKRCFACLGLHNLSNCNSKYTCTSCGSKRHNTLLHFEKQSVNVVEAGLASKDIPPEASVSLANSCSHNTLSHSLLGTAQAHILNAAGQWQSCRLLLDPGSQVNFISASLADRLSLARKRCPYDLKAVGHVSIDKTQGLVHCCISPLTSSIPSINFPAVILPRITSELPLVPISQDLRDRFASLNLADPDFHTTAPIDILLAVDSVLELTPSIPAIIKGSPSAVLTHLGWVIMGKIPDSSANSVVSMHVQIQSPSSLDDTLRRFWECEEIREVPFVSPQDLAAEQFFCDTVSRSDTGRYVTRLPFRSNTPPSLGCNREIALKRYLNLEVQFKRRPDFRRLYVENIQNYICQGHLVLATRSEPYILTHHGVTKVTSQGPQVRVVFNPAEKDSRGVTLNDTLMSGPKLQSDIAEVITRFRLPKVALTCDIRQMFRAIVLHPADRKYQHIFWRVAPDEPVREYEHTRVIFGATCSPFLAQRTIQQLIKDEGSNFPLAASALESSIYVDDILTGADSEADALELRNQLMDLLGKGGFELGKWASSSERIIHFDSALPRVFPVGLAPVKVLGLRWDPQVDSFGYQIHNDNETATKRGILSRIARTYDVNGYLSPFVFTLKTLMQQLWLLKVEWDEPLLGEVAEKWERIVRELPMIERVSIPRCIQPFAWVHARLVGFSDASSLGMAAVIYLRLQGPDSAGVYLVAAKTRVAPLKGWTIPRLELGAACLLARTLNSVRPSFSSLKLDIPVCFTDSATALAWIRTPPYRLKTFEANRVAQIHEAGPDVSWRHVPGKENPADAASRGMMPSDLLSHSLWWNGPNFLYETESAWPKRFVSPSSDLPELNDLVISSHLSTHDVSVFSDLLERSSSLLRVQRVISYMKRFLHNCSARVKKNPDIQPLTGYITGSEYRQALELIIKVTQVQHLESEIKLMQRASLCSRRYRALSPFLSPHGFVMVGGRLKYANLAERSRHPYLIPRNSHLATLLVDHFHLHSGHGGPQLVQSLLHRQFWIPSARDLIRKRVFHCLTCYRFRARPVQPPMADLPNFRIRPSRCFSRTGIDYAGPFFVKASLGRTTRSVKSYMALFVCMVTKAIHLEAVTNLTTDNFLAALDRFISRRGLPAHIFSDQGRNFKGAAREITELTTFLNNSNENIAQYLASREIEWHFNPPYAPHFGGLWESGVKSTKHHFKRMIGAQILTFEEFSTVLARIEAILNSRPLCQISNSPDDDFDYLTPGHFLIGAPILARPEACLLEVPSNRQSRWQLTRHLIQSFWRRWSSEYVHTQLMRPKWVAPAHPLKVGDLVFWYSPGSLPTHWPRGRVLELLPGKDGVARVVRLRTATGDVVRPATKVVPLPMS